MRITKQQRADLSAALLCVEDAKEVATPLLTPETDAKLTEAVNRLAHFLCYSGQRPYSAGQVADDPWPKKGKVKR